MKRMTKKLGAIVLAMAMCLSLCCTALVSAADEGTYTITISNTTQGYTYAAYKIFDATVGTEGNVAYSIQTSNPWFSIITENMTPDEDTGVYTTECFVLTPTDDTTYTVTVKDDVDDATILEYFNSQIVMTKQEDGTYKLTAPDGVEASAETTATSSTLTLDVSEDGAGYYFVTSTMGATVTITTTDPQANVIDKNTPPGNLKKVMAGLDKESDDVHAGADTIGDDVEFIVTANVPLYAPGDTDSQNGYLVVDYEFDDEMTVGLEIRGLVENTQYTVDSDGRYWATDSLIDSWITLTQGDTTYTFTEVVPDYTLELIYPSYDENNELQFDGFILKYRTVDDDTWEKLQNNEEGQYYKDASEITTTYPVNAVITIDYTAHITEDVDYENTNHIDMHWGLTPFNNPHTPEYTGHDYDEDEVYVLELDITKLDEETQAALAGAEFKLTGSNLKQVINGTSYVFESLSYDEYVAAKSTGAELWFALTDESGISFAGSPITYTNVDPYDLIDEAGEKIDDKTAAELEKYAVDTQLEEYPYVAYTLTVTHTGELQDADDSSVTGTTDSSGHLTFVGLTVGEYTLTEIKAPDGYNLLPEELTFTISVTFDDNDQPTWTITNGEGQSTDFTYNNGVVSITVLNSQGTPLPSTGGIGTTIFYIIGGVLVVGAVVVLVTRRRMTREG